ncbi:MAG: Maf family nucleotide pyrophosphatase [Bacteroidales bacterium]
MKIRYHILLGSSSPRRRQLMEGLGLPFDTVVIEGIDEHNLPGDIAPEDIPLHLAKTKSYAYNKPLQNKELLVTADTLVFNGGSVLGKPRTHAEACSMLRDLSGRFHTVITGVFVRSADEHRIAGGITDKTKVWFSKLEEEEIRYYVNTYKPYDKAGAYGVQEWIGYMGIERIEGSFYNVMGFPIHAFWSFLKKVKAVEFP